MLNFNGGRETVSQRMKKAGVLPAFFFGGDAVVFECGNQEGWKGKSRVGEAGIWNSGTRERRGNRASD
jgi:hypothetical protein